MTKEEVLVQGKFIEQKRKEALEKGLTPKQVEEAINNYIRKHLGVKPASFSKVYSYYLMEEAEKRPTALDFVGEMVAPLDVLKPVREKYLMPHIPTTEEMEQLGWKQPFTGVHRVGREFVVPALTDPITYSPLLYTKIKSALKTYKPPKKETLKETSRVNVPKDVYTPTAKVKELRKKPAPEVKPFETTLEKTTPTIPSTYTKIPEDMTKIPADVLVAKTPEEITEILARPQYKTIPPELLVRKTPIEVSKVIDEVIKDPHYTTIPPEIIIRARAKTLVEVATEPKDKIPVSTIKTKMENNLVDDIVEDVVEDISGLQPVVITSKMKPDLSLTDFASHTNLIDAIEEVDSLIIPQYKKFLPETKKLLEAKKYKEAGKNIAEITDTFKQRGYYLHNRVDTLARDLNVPANAVKLAIHKYVPPKPIKPPKPRVKTITLPDGTRKVVDLDTGKWTDFTPKDPYDYVLKTEGRLAIPDEKIGNTTTIGVKPKNFEDALSENPNQNFDKIQQQINAQKTSMAKILTAINYINEKLRPLQEEAVKTGLKEKFAEAIKYLRTAPTRGQEKLAGYKQQFAGRVTMTFPKLKELVKQEDIDNLADILIKASVPPKVGKLSGEGMRLSASNAFQKFFSTGELPTPSEVDAFRYFFGDDLTEGLLGLTKRGYNWIDYLNVSKALMGSADLSAPLRQGFFLLSRHPIKALKSTQMMLRTLKSEDAFVELEKNITSRPTFAKMKIANLAVKDFTKPIERNEEIFLGARLAEKIPIAKYVVRASERAYVGFLHKLRADVFDDIYYKATKINPALENDTKFLKALGSYINTTTGRGELGFLSRYADALNVLFFSPRLITSRLSLLNPVYYMKLPPIVRRHALETLVLNTSVAFSLLSLATAMGFKVSYDALSPKFLKIQDKDVYIDLLGGFIPYFVLGARLLSGSQMKTLDDQVRQTNPLTLLSRFFSYKEAPIPSFITTLLYGKDWLGNDLWEIPPTTLSMEAAKRFTPMVFWDLYELYKDRGLAASVIAPLPVFGAGVQVMETKYDFSHFFTE